MNQQIVPPRLGQKILVVVDNTPLFLDTLRVVVTSLSDIAERFFTLIHCCPTMYWEHGGADNPEVKAEIEQAWATEEEQFEQTEKFLAKARTIFEDAGVPSAHLKTMMTTEEDSLIDATITELRRGNYSGIIVTQYHDDIVNRLLKRGITDAFRQIPEVAVWAIDTKDVTRTE